MPIVLRSLLFALLALSLARAENKPLWLACGPADLLKAIEPLAEHRRAEGMETLLLPLAPEAALAKAPRRPDYFVLVGDDTLADSAQPWRVAAQRLPFHSWQVGQRPLQDSIQNYVDSAR